MVINHLIYSIDFYVFRSIICFSSLRNNKKILSYKHVPSACENFWAGPQFEIKLSFLFYALPFLWFTRFQQNFEETQVVSIREKNQKAYSTLVSRQIHLSLSLLLLINFKNYSLIWSLTCTDKVLFFPYQPIHPCALIFNFEASDFVLMQDFTRSGWIWDFLLDE